MTVENFRIRNLAAKGPRHGEAEDLVSFASAELIQGIPLAGRLTIGMEDITGGLKVPSLRT